MSGILINPYAVATPDVVPGTEAAAFLARTSGLDSAHTNAYATLINGLVADGIWSKFDVFYVFATQDSTTALLNLVSASFNGTSHGSPTFTADRGFTGVDSSSTVYIDTGFNPSTATTPLYTRDSAHQSVWNLTNVGTPGPDIGSAGAASAASNLYTKYNGDNNTYFRTNVTSAGGQSASIADARGHYIADRSSSSTMNGYKTGSSVYSSGAQTSIAVLNMNMYALGINNNGSPFGAAHQQAVISIGSSMNATEFGNFYSRLRTYMTAVGAP